GPFSFACSNGRELLIVWLATAELSLFNRARSRHSHICRRPLTQPPRPPNGRLVLRKLFVPQALVAASLVLPSTAQAEGYYSGYKGAHAEGRGGAFVAKADDISAAHFNPAAFAWQKGTRIQLSNRFSYNHWAYQRATTEDWGNTADPGVPTSFEKTQNGVPFQALEPMIGISTD